MADYGHELAFGTFLTPQATRPRERRRARAADRARRARPRHLPGPPVPVRVPGHVDADDVGRRQHGDAADRAERAQPAAAPARRARALRRQPRPAVAAVASSSASAPARSGTRSRRWAARSCTPGESVTALSEAIDVIRQIWDVTTRRGVRVDGEHYVVKGAKRGPEPAHDIPIHLGAYKPRMLRLTGTKADGWLPSQAYMQPGDYAPANARIDEAAPPRRAATRARSGGCSTSTRATSTSSSRSRSSTASPPSSSAATIRTRSSASARRSRPPCARRSRRSAPSAGRPAAPSRGPAALAQRDARASTTTRRRSPPSSPATAPTARSARPTCARARPGLVLQPENAEEVSQALVYAREQDVPLAVRSGGHGISGRSTNDGGIVIDLGKLDGIAVDGDAGAARPGRALGPRGAGARPSTGSG